MQDGKIAKKPYQTGMAGRVRSAAKKLDCPEGFSRSDVYHYIDNIKPLSSAEEKTFSRTWEDFRKRGEIKRFGHAKYRYVKGLAPKPDVRRKIFRAMYVRRAFTTAQIRMLTDADSSYIQALTRKLVKAEHLEDTGRKGREKVFRVRHADKFYVDIVQGDNCRARN